MALENTTKIQGLVSTNPTSTDKVSEGDNHLRLIKSILQSSFPSDIEVQIPDVAEVEDGNVLIVKGGNTEWSSTIDWRDVLSVNGYAMRSVFAIDQSGNLVIGPGSYDLSGIGIVHIDWSESGPLTIPQSSFIYEGWNYVYLDYSEITDSLSEDPEARVSVSSSGVKIDISSEPPVYNPNKRGFYLNEEDRCIFAVFKETDGSLRKFHHDGGNYVQYIEQIVSPRYINTTTNWQVVQSNIPFFARYVDVNFWFDSTTQNATDLYWKSKLEDNIGHKLFRLDANNAGEKNRIATQAKIYCGSTDGERTFYIRLHQSSPQVDGNLGFNGFYLPNGI